MGITGRLLDQTEIVRSRAIITPRLTSMCAIDCSYLIPTWKLYSFNTGIVHNNAISVVVYAMCVCSY